jgi:hypothetical protein
MYFCMCWYGCKYHDQGAERNMAQGAERNMVQGAERNMVQGPVVEHGSRSGSGTWFKER